MIKIDMPMPKNCLDCPACNEYLMCAMPVNGRKWGENNVREFGQCRPGWCPLKEQEAVKPYIDIDEAKCPICKVRLTRQELIGDDVLFEDFFDYCPHCGRSVKWDA